METCTMRWPPLIFFVYLLFGLIIHSSLGSPGEVSDYVYALCTGMNTVAPNSKYQTNLNTLLSLLSSNSGKKNHYYNATVGSGLDPVYGLYFCRGDITLSACRDCVSLATNALASYCHGERVSIVWYYDQCVVRYSNESFMGAMTDDPMIPMWNRENSLDIQNVTSNMTAFMQVLVGTLGEAAVQASNSQLDRKFATKEGKFGANMTSLNRIYTLVECTPDISLGDCKNCLQRVIGNTSNLCNVKAGCTLMCPNCYMRYDIYGFYSDALAATSGPSPVHIIQGTHAYVRKRKRAVLFGASGATVSVLAFLFGMCSFGRKKKTTSVVNELNDIEQVESLKFDFNTLRIATNDFSVHNKLGEGGFGEVFKGKLESGQEIAVKRLSNNSRQGIAEFKTEVLVIAKLQHQNLVRLLGFCQSRAEKLLIYEFLPNLSLDQILFDPEKCASLDWETRYKIIQGIARGLLYLHEDSRVKVIHRDLKSSNVLLDKDMNPKISDFGIAKLFQPDETQGSTSNIAGTLGYMAPEYLVTGKYSARSDVYSFGVMVLEIVSGQRNSHLRREYGESLLHHAWALWNEERAMELIDPKLGNSFSEEEVVMCIHIGLLSTEEVTARRPKMASVVAALNGNAIVLPLPG